MTYVHPLQPELYSVRFQLPPWSHVSHANRWVLSFARSYGDAPSELPNHVVDLVTSWLSHISSADLINAQSRLDAPEWVFQDSFNKFRISLGMKGKREVPVQPYGDLKGYLDHMVDESMGVEFLIRSGSDNRYNATGLLTEGSKTLKSLLNHAARVCKESSSSRNQSCYSNIADKCTKGYVTILVATLTTTTVQDEWGNFKKFIALLEGYETTAGMLKRHIMVAVAHFGWSTFTVFLHQPGESNSKPIKFKIPRKRLMFTVVDNKLWLARHFYPRPTKVWAQQLANQDGRLCLTSRAFRVAPEEDNISSLAKAIKIDCGLTLIQPLQIYNLRHAGSWVEAKVGEVLYASTEFCPYGFVIPD